MTFEVCHTSRLHKSSKTYILKICLKMKKMFRIRAEDMYRCNILKYN